MKTILEPSRVQQEPGQRPPDPAHFQLRLEDGLDSSAPPTVAVTTSRPRAEGIGRTLDEQMT